jgi:hypothetical protein
VLAELVGVDRERVDREQVAHARQAPSVDVRGLGAAEGLEDDEGDLGDPNSAELST